MRAKWSIVVAAVSLVLAVLALAPLADSARGIFAANSDRIDGIHASKTAKPGMLVPLGKNAKFPASVVPTVKGDTGATGVVGPQGPKGDTGATGAVGHQGPKGDTGAVGHQGPKGDTGATGAVGHQGPTGDTGATGAVGHQGPKGEQGLKGDPGGATTFTLRSASKLVNPADGATQEFTVSCLTDEHATGGGASAIWLGDGGMQLAGSYPKSDGLGWTAFIPVRPGANSQLYAYVVCASRVAP